MKLTINQLTVILDDSNGGILSLSHPKARQILSVAPEQACLLDVAYPIPSFIPMRLAARFSRAEISGEENGAVRIHWPALGPSRRHVPLPEGRVSAT
ncbi:MAG TPA: hypothetical protein DD727_03015, partial [Clostridiales bacterium]|nr:hypothetical protein [Clostridiales bacterium]